MNEMYRDEARVEHMNRAIQKVQKQKLDQVFAEERVAVSSAQKESVILYRSI